MKKRFILFAILMSVFLVITPVTIATSEQIDSSGDTSAMSSGETVLQNVEDRNGNSSETTIGRLETKEEKIAYYTEKCGSSINGKVMYYLYEIQKYSIPVCFIGLVIASLNFFIIGNKKLDKREQGFSMLIGFGLGLIVFQVLPLLFAIIVAGR